MCSCLWYPEERESEGTIKQEPEREMVRGEPCVKIRRVMRKGYEAEAWTRKWRWRKKKRHQNESNVATGQQSGRYMRVHFQETIKKPLRRCRTYTAQAFNTGPCFCRRITPSHPLHV